MAEMLAPARPREQHRYTVADMAWMAQQPEYADCRFELIEGEMVDMPQPNELHAYLADEIYFAIRLYLMEHNLGRVVRESGHYMLADEATLLAPDVGFRRIDTAAHPPASRWEAQMPDLAVESKSPNDTFAHMRRKAELYLRRGTQIVWLVYPERRGVEVCTLDKTGEIAREFITEDGSLSGGDALPGFVLELRRLFS